MRGKTGFTWLLDLEIVVTSVCYRIILKSLFPVELCERAYHWSFLISTLYLLLENYIPVRQVLKGRFKIFILDSYSNHCQLHSMVDADDGVLHAMNQEQGRVAFDKLCLLQKTCSLVCPQGLGIISWSKIFAGLELV